MRRRERLVILPLILTTTLVTMLSAVVWRPGSAGEARPSAADAAARSLRARSAAVTLTVTAAGAPPFRVSGHVTMARGETRWQLPEPDTELLVVGSGMAVIRADGEWASVPITKTIPFDDVAGVLETIAAGAPHDLAVDVGSSGRVTRITATAADGRAVLRLGPYAREDGGVEDGHER